MNRAMYAAHQGGYAYNLHKDLKVIWKVTVLFACNFYPFVPPATTVIAEGHNYNDLLGFLELAFEVCNQSPHPTPPPLQEPKHKAYSFTGGCPAAEG